MKIRNSFVQESFVWNGYSADSFRDAAKRLSDIIAYLHELDEHVYGRDDLYDQEILQDTPIYSFYERDEEDPLHDIKQSVILSLQGMFIEEGETFDDEIGLQFYTIDDPKAKPLRQSAGLTQYLSRRRDILADCTDCREFSSFMRTCFPDIVFSGDVDKGLRSIPNFSKPDVRTAIAHDLGVLNDEAIGLYREYYPDVGKMCQALGTKVLACSIDTPRHNKHLFFSFSYTDDAKNIQIKSVLCSPHTKLMRKDSNLRIYFAWKDAEVGAGQKVLVGCIGGHPYPKGE